MQGVRILVYNVDIVIIIIIIVIIIIDLVFFVCHSVVLDIRRETSACRQHNK